jgi:hypothetical protein
VCDGKNLFFYTQQIDFLPICRPISPRRRLQPPRSHNQHRDKGQS